MQPNEIHEIQDLSEEWQAGNSANHRHKVKGAHTTTVGSAGRCYTIIWWC